MDLTQELTLFNIAASLVGILVILTVIAHVLVAKHKHQNK